jgi:hypothetical protein
MEFANAKTYCGIKWSPGVFEGTAGQLLDNSGLATLKAVDMIRLRAIAGLREHSAAMVSRAVMRRSEVAKSSSELVPN